MQPLSVSDVALTVGSFGCYMHKFATIKVVSYIIVYAHIHWRLSSGFVLPFVCCLVAI